MRELQLYDDDYEDNEVYDQDYEDDSAFIGALAFISKWFIRIGMVIAVILFIYYIINGKLSTGLLFILGLVVAYFIGYGFMFLLDKIVDSD